MSNKRKEEHLPAGFFDDPVADAKARKLNVKEEVAKAQEREWQDFQNFVASVETEETSEEKVKTAAEEAEEVEALEKLQQMQYMNRVRKTILLVTKADASEVKDEDTAELENVEDPTVDSPAEIVAQVMEKRAALELNRKALDDAENATDDDDNILDWRAKQW
ncbi:hypothetical protein H310_08007 [Aphanomyces invadans]|uniref:ZNF380 coiled-coil domain-containing protein n=1 Tax=Aphanomyces invadans TaxID=157072 RepID=A0A024U049_9STRA|nr:hypothetical protein H310_08007 [Aphanomyces invadans]ETV99266.1 hypothetical protein H310_08007 [Aphanomyces invadans]RHY33226.1 hypothetical protein DYB32_001781 [Aphanomyces invadans]|eukprot:XP_008871822.1 hypothetical protein H310_08007 [Aphanomyces invadans]